MSLDENLPRINFPKESGEYKVVQLDINGQPYLRFAEKGRETHAIILMLLAHKLRREYPEMEISRGIFGKDKIPALEAEWYTVHGMGKSRIDVEQRHASLYGDSQDYGIGIDTEHLDFIKDLAPDWSFKYENESS